MREAQVCSHVYFRLFADEKLLLLPAPAENEKNAKKGEGSQKRDKFALCASIPIGQQKFVRPSVSTEGDVPGPKHCKFEGLRFHVCVR